MRMRVMSLLWFAPFLCAVVLSPKSQSWLQQDELPIGVPGHQVHLLLTRAEARRELRMSEAQGEAVVRLADRTSMELGEAFASVYMLRGEERIKKWAELSKQIDDRWKANIAQILNPEQLRRCRQIDMQRRDLFVLEEPEIATLLSLTKAQSESCAQIIHKYRTAMQEHIDGAEQFQPGEEDMLEKTAIEQLKAQLTEKQLELWRQAVGPAFNGGWPGFGP
jgi:hypothetical protein